MALKTKLVEMPSGKMREVRANPHAYTAAEKREIAKIRKVYPGMSRSRAHAIAGRHKALRP